ncbi:MAG: hypothetical protein AAGA42_20065 [Actinomycetota bacterium]
MIKQRRAVAAACAAALVFTMAACSDDDDGDSGSEATAAAADSGDSDDSGGDSGGDSADSGDSGDSGGDSAGGSDPAVEEFCDLVDELAEEAQAILDDPANADAARVAELTTELTTQAPELAGSVTPENAERLQECTDVLNSVGT